MKQPETLYIVTNEKDDSTLKFRAKNMEEARHYAINLVDHSKEPWTIHEVFKK